MSHLKVHREVTDVGGWARSILLLIREPPI